MSDLERWLADFRDITKEIQPMIDKLGELRALIKSHCIETGESLEIEGVSVTVRRGSRRTTWDKKALEELAIVYPQIADCREETRTSPVVNIKVKQ